MQYSAESGYLIPDMLTENSRFSTPRSSVGDGISTDCEADVESNMSGNSEVASPHRRKSSYGIYGIVHASRPPAMLLSKADSENAQHTNEMGGKIISLLRDVFTSYKAIVVLVIILIMLLVIGFFTLFPYCLKSCHKTNHKRTAQHALESKWPMQFSDVVPIANMLIIDINGDNESDIIIAYSNVSKVGQLISNVSFITILDGKTGRMLKKLELAFLASKIYTDPQSKVNLTGFVTGGNGIVVKMSLRKGIILWESHPCSTIHSFLVIKDIDNDDISDLVLVCSWMSVMDTTLSGIVLVSGANGNFIGSKIRYQLGQRPSNFLMQHENAKNETCILFGIQRNGKSTVLAVRLKRLLEVATGTRSKVNLVSENPLVVARNVRDDRQPAYADISGDGVKDVGFILLNGMIAFIDGATLSLRKTIDTKSSDIIRISVLPDVGSGYPSLAVLKTNQGGCQRFALSIYDFANIFHPNTIVLPKIPSIIDEVDLDDKHQFIFWFPQSQEPCRANPDKEVNDSTKENGSQRTLYLSGRTTLPVQSKVVDATDDIELETIDKDVLNSLREYVGIDDKGVTRHHKLFHLVCNYLLLRFLISYGITTESVLRDFKSTRNHLLSLSNKNLGKALTDQLKGLLANDYDENLDIPTWFDDIENDIDWLRDVDGKGRFKAKRDIYSLNGLGHVQKPEMTINGLDGGEYGERHANSMLHSLQITPDGEKGNSRSVINSEILMSKLDATHKANIQVQEADGIGHSQKLAQGDGGKDSASPISTQCSIPRPVFERLLINKIDYKWVELKIPPHQDRSRPLSDRGRVLNHAIKECPGFSMRVIELIVYRDYFYYVALYKRNSRNASFMMQVDRVKSNQAP